MKIESNPTSQAHSIPIHFEPARRQRRWQVKMRAMGRCWRCGQPAIGSPCGAHSVKAREVQHRINQYQKRSLRARSCFLGVATNAGQS